MISMRKLGKMTAFLLSALMIISAFPFVSAADASTIAEFPNFKSAWKGNGENKYFKITNDFMNGTSNGAIAYAGVAKLTIWFNY